MQIDRRNFLIGGAASLVAAQVGARESAVVPIIDTHIHLYDPSRPQGVPYAGPPNSSTGKTGAWPDIYERMAKPHGVVGAIEVEASPWIEDNLWVLQVAAEHEIMVGKVGNLDPLADDFSVVFDRFCKNPLFRGIRYGNIWGYDLTARSGEPTFIAALRHVAEADRTLDTGNQNVEMLEAVVRVNDAIPKLRIVLDHLPAYIPDSKDERRYEALLRELRDRPLVYCKLSAIIREIDGTVRKDLAPHRGRLDRIYEAFGEDRVLFGSDWPNSDGVASFADVVSVAREYFSAKSRVAQEKYFWANSVHAYKWVRRSEMQPALDA